ncbi:hypothetical protein Ciccas_013586, partial [Cichlidogyrus casuarinus]
VITSPDKLESDRALLQLCNGKTSNLPQVKEFMSIIDGYPGQVRICDRVGLGIGDRHYNHVTMSILQQIQHNLLEGQSFYTVQGAVYWIIKEWDLRMYAKFVLSCQRPQRMLSPSVIKELRTVRRHRRIDSHLVLSARDAAEMRPTYELELIDGSTLTCFGDGEGCPCLNAMKAQMCGHILYLVHHELYEPGIMQPLVSRTQLAIEEDLFLKSKFLLCANNERNFAGLRVNLRPLPRPEIPHKFTFHASVSAVRLGNLNLVRQMVDVLNRLPLQELHLRLLGANKVVQMLTSAPMSKDNMILSLCATGQNLSRVYSANRERHFSLFQQDAQFSVHHPRFLPHEEDEDLQEDYMARMDDASSEHSYVDDQTQYQDIVRNTEMDSQSEEADELVQWPESSTQSRGQADDRAGRKTMATSSGYSAGRFSYATDFEEQEEDLFDQHAAKRYGLRSLHKQQPGRPTHFDLNETSGENTQQMEREAQEAAFFLQPHRK